MEAEVEAASFKKVEAETEAEAPHAEVEAEVEASTSLVPTLIIEVRVTTGLIDM